MASKYSPSPNYRQPVVRMRVSGRAPEFLSHFAYESSDRRPEGFGSMHTLMIDNDQDEAARRVWRDERAGIRIQGSRLKHLFVYEVSWS